MYIVNYHLQKTELKYVIYLLFTDKISLERYPRNSLPLTSPERETG